MKFLIKCILIFNSFFAFCQIPQNNLIFWVDGSSIDTLNQRIVEWSDMSGNNNNAFPEHAVRSPFIRENVYQWGNKTVVDFRRSDITYLRTISSLLQSSNYSIFIAFKRNNSNIEMDLLAQFCNACSGKIVWGVNHPNSSPQPDFWGWSGTLMNVLPFPEYSLISMINDGTSGGHKTYLNSILKSTNSFTNAPPTTPFTIGLRRISSQVFSKVLDGEIAEIIIYDYDLNQQEQNIVENYLMNKYSSPVDIGPDITIPHGFCDTTLSTSNYYESYLWSNGSTDSVIHVSQPGIYWLETIDIFGRVSRDSLVLNRPVLNYPSNINICPNDSILWDSGLDNSYNFLWSNSMISSSINVLDSGNYYLTVNDTLGCFLESDTLSFALDLYSTIANLGNDTSFCSGNSIELVSGSSQTVSYLWNNMQTSPSLIIDTSGAYNLYATNTNGCELFDTINVTITGDAPNIQISFPDTVCELIEFPISDFSTVSSPALIDSISWDLGNGNFSNQYSDTISYLDSGLFNVNVFLSTNQGCFIDSTFSILVNPIPNFLIQSQGICDYDSISFSVVNNGNISLSHYDWTFDDSLSGINNFDSINSPNHLFSSNGIYNISLIVEDINGCVDTSIQQVEIFPSPLADFAISEACEGNLIQIDNNSVIDSSYSISGYLWSFGDNTQSNDSVPAKYFDTYGVYSIQLICTADSSLCTDTLVDSITINANPILNWDASVACKNTWTSFSNLSTVPNDSIFQTLWVVNVLDSINANQIDYQFITTGGQQIQLQTSSSNLCVSDSVFMINVNDEIDLTYQTDPVVITTQIPFSCLLNDSINLSSVIWDFGDGVQSNLYSPNHTYNMNLNGDTLIILTAGTNLIGCVDTIIKSVVLSSPVVDLELRQLLLSENDGFYSIIVEMKNNGTISLSDVELLVNIPNSNPIKEITGISLESGENIYYPVNVNPSSYNSSQDSLLGFLCVEGVSFNEFGLEELMLENNWICQNTEKDSLNLIALYPNPIQNNINVLLHVPKESHIDFEIVDLNGKIVNKPILPKMYASGTYKVSIDATALSEGFYFFHVLDDRNNRIIRSFIK